MSRPIFVEVVPSHVHLSLDDMHALFGDRHDGTVLCDLSQSGQFAQKEVVTVEGPKGNVVLRVLGPSRVTTQVELTPTEAAMLGVEVPTRCSGSTEGLATVTLRTTNGKCEMRPVALIPQPHLHLSDSDARQMRLQHHDVVHVDVVGRPGVGIDDVIVRVHPTYRTRLHLHQDLARDMWIASGDHVQIRDHGLL